jgi:hypothetical protein
MRTASLCASAIRTASSSDNVVAVVVFDDTGVACALVTAGEITIAAIATVALNVSIAFI